MAVSDAPPGMPRHRASRRDRRRAPARTSEVVAPSRDQAELAGPRPSVVVDNVHIEYKVFGKRATTESRMPGWARGHVGAIERIKAVKGVSFTINHGDSVGLIGHNGSGKSTILRAIAGVLPVTRGAVYTDGDASLLGVGGVLMRNMTGERNIVLGGLALGLTPAEVAARYDDVVKFADIGDSVSLPMKTYSSGMGARLRFAISTVREPDILLIDEALATGDASFKRRSQAKINEIRKNAGTVVLVSHGMNTIRETCNRALWMHRGRLHMDGSVDEVVNAYEASLG